MSKSRAVVPYNKKSAVNSAVGSGKSKGNPVGNLFIVILFAVPGLIMFTPTTLVMLFGMAPTVIALVADKDPQKYAALTVGPLNFAASFPRSWNSGLAATLWTWRCACSRFQRTG